MKVGYACFHIIIEKCGPTAAGSTAEPVLSAWYV